MAHFLAVAVIQSNRSAAPLRIQDEHVLLLPVCSEETHVLCVLTKPAFYLSLPANGERVHRSSQSMLKTHSSVSPPVPLRRRRTASQGLSLNRSQYGGCSTKYNTPAGTQVVYRRFGGEQVVFPESSQTELKPEQ